VRSFVPRPELSGIDASGPPAQRYQILGRFASGAMGQIFLARMRLYGGGTKEVALKRIRPELQLDKDTVEMFVDEASIASKMNHPNIVQIFELGDLDGSMFIAMELVSGTNLQGLGQRLREAKRPFPPDLAVKIACDTLEALGYAHDFADERGQPLKIVHRDVSPQNIHLSFQGEVKLLDFGVSRAEGRLHKTHPGLMKGKLAFMAPEQIQGSAVDGRADLFGLGALLYEALLGRHPFFGRTEAMVLRAIVDGRPIAPTDVDPEFSPELAAILMKALEKQPERRYQNAAAMHQALYAFAAGQQYDLSKRHLGLFLRNELRERHEQERRARAIGDDELLVAAYQGRIVEATISRRASSGRLLPPPRHPSPPTTRIALLPAPPPPGAIVETNDLPPLVRNSLSEILAEELANPQPPPPPPPRRDESRLGRYQLLRRLRTRGPIETYLARQSGPGRFERVVELERLAPERANDPGRAEAFLRVTQLMASFGDPRLETVLDFQTEPEVHRTLEHRDGLFLDTVFERCRQLGVRLPVPAVCRIGSLIALAAHTLHVGRPSVRASIHRDLGPHRVQLLRHGQVVLSGFDFLRPQGMAMLVAEDPRDRVDAAPPESLNPALGPEGPATDLYGIGLVLAEGLTLRAPFSRGSPAATKKAILEEPFLLSRNKEDPSGRLTSLVESCLAKRPADRPASALAVARELEALIFEQGRPYSSADLASWMAEHLPFIGP
jgi:serine/threonine protein kinase